MNERVKRAGDLFLKLYDRFSILESKKFGSEDMSELTIIEIKTIIVIGRHNGSIKMSEIAQALGVTTGTPTVTVDRLIKKGYAQRMRDEEDRRIVFVELTEKGRVNFEKVVKIKDNAIIKIFGIVGEEQIDNLINILSDIEDGFDQAFAVNS